VRLSWACVPLTRGWLRQVQFSPFEENKLAVAAAQHYGIVGNGRLFVAGFGPGGASVLAMYAHTTPTHFHSPLARCLPSRRSLIMAAYALCVCRFDTQDGLYDVAWSEVNEHQLVAASGDGALRLFDTNIRVRVARS
jgi:peroxin-7